MEEIQSSDEMSEAQEVKTPQPKSKSKLILIIVRIIRVLIIVGVFFLVLMIFYKVSGFIYDKTQIDPEEEASKGTIDVYAKKAKTQPLLAFDAGQYNFEIQSANPNQINAIVKTHIALVYDATTLSDYDPKAITQSQNILAHELEERKLQIRDIMRNMLVQKSYEEIHGTQNMLRVKKELMNRINHILVNGKISDIYFTEWNIIPTGY